MVLFTFYTNLSDEYKILINEIIKVLTILLVFQYMVSWCLSADAFVKAFTSGFLNDTFMSMLIYIILGIITYYLVIEELIEIN